MNSLKVYEDQKETNEEKKEEEEKNKDTHKDLFPEDEEEQPQDNSPSKSLGLKHVNIVVIVCLSELSRYVHLLFL